MTNAIQFIVEQKRVTDEAGNVSIQSETLGYSARPQAEIQADLAALSDFGDESITYDVVEIPEANFAPRSCTRYTRTVTVTGKAITEEVTVKTANVPAFYPMRMYDQHYPQTKPTEFKTVQIVENHDPELARMISETGRPLDTDDLSDEMFSMARQAYKERKPVAFGDVLIWVQPNGTAMITTAHYTCKLKNIWLYDGQVCRAKFPNVPFVPKHAAPTTS